MEVDPAVEQAYEVCLDQLLALTMTERHGEPAPHIVDLSDEAREAWTSFYDAWGLEQAAVFAELAAAYAKLEAYAARFALIHHVVSHVGRGEDSLAPIGLESVQAGITLCRWFAAEARRVYGILAETGDQRETRRLIEWVRAGAWRQNHGKGVTERRASTGAGTMPKKGAAQPGDVYGRWVDRPSAWRVRREAHPRFSGRRNRRNPLPG